MSSKKKFVEMKSWFLSCFLVVVVDSRCMNVKIVYPSNKKLILILVLSENFNGWHLWCHCNRWPAIRLLSPRLKWKLIDFRAIQYGIRVAQPLHYISLYCSDGIGITAYYSRQWWSVELRQLLCVEENTKKKKTKLSSHCGTKIQAWAHRSRIAVIQHDVRTNVNRLVSIE